MAPALRRGRPAKQDAPRGEASTSAQLPGATDGAVPASPAAGATDGPQMPDKLRTLLQRLRSEVEKHCDHVGTAFAEEARRIHYGESKARAIYGETTPSEAEALADEGIEFGVLPWPRRSDS